MSRGRIPRWPAWLAVLAAAALVVIPLPGFLTPFRPSVLCKS